MFWVVDNFLMRKSRKAKGLQCKDDTVKKVKYQRHVDVEAGSDEEAVLLGGAAGGESGLQEELYRRDVRR